MWKKQYYDAYYNLKKDDLNENLTEILLLKSPYLKKLYRYRANPTPTSTHSLAPLKNDTIYLNSASKFNDPYDCGLTMNQEKVSHEITKSAIVDKVVYDLVENGLIHPSEIQEPEKNEMVTLLAEVPLKYVPWVMASSLTKNPVIQASIEGKIDAMIQFLVEPYETYIKSLRDFYQSSINVACFSESNDSILMWSHYANNHEGFCIEYDFSEILSENPLLLHSLHPVYYTNEIFDLFNYRSTDKIFAQVLAAINKSDVWSYENEWRFIKDSKEEQLQPFLKPCAVILGTKISCEDKATITEICTERSIPIKVSAKYSTPSTSSTDMRQS